jgi:exopolysaccharide biosynthesis polyprenyl glycosylphosphotransferase
VHPVVTVTGTLLRDRILRAERAQLIDCDSLPAASLQYEVLKRAFDMVFSVLVLALTSPLLLAIALVTKLTSPGPVLFRQQRVGLSGELFTMYKFRTMRVATESESDTVWTTSDDPRRTRLGCLLRRTGLDELPQFFNVLAGNMSVVGPRPERPHYVKKFRSEIARYQSRHRLKVGITGWAQIHGWRGDTSIQKRLEYDLYYVQHWTFWLDMKIIFRTLFGAFTGKNAY